MSTFRVFFNDGNYQDYEGDYFEIVVLNGKPDKWIYFVRAIDKITLHRILLDKVYAISKNI